MVEVFLSLSYRLRNAKSDDKATRCLRDKVTFRNICKNRSAAEKVMLEKAWLVIFITSQIEEIKVSMLFWNCRNCQWSNENRSNLHNTILPIILANRKGLLSLKSYHTHKHRVIHKQNKLIQTMTFKIKWIIFELCTFVIINTITWSMKSTFNNITIPHSSRASLDNFKLRGWNDRIS